MTAPVSSEAAASASRRSPALLVAALALIAIVAGLVVVFGVTRPPELPSIAEAGWVPPGAVAGVVHSDGAGCTALVIVRPDGSRHEVTCADQLGDVLGWDPTGIATTSWDGPEAGIDYLDPESGDIVLHEAWPGGASVVYAGGISTDWRDGTLVVRAEGSGLTLWTVDAPRSYRIEGGSRSPDGQWYALVDSFGRLLLVRYDGSSTPVVWANDVQFDSWPGPVWEGQGVGSTLRKGD